MIPAKNLNITASSFDWTLQSNSRAIMSVDRHCGTFFKLFFDDDQRSFVQLGRVHLDCIWKFLEIFHGPRTELS